MNTTRKGQSRFETQARWLARLALLTAAVCGCSKVPDPSASRQHRPVDECGDVKCTPCGIAIAVSLLDPATGRAPNSDISGSVTVRGASGVCETWGRCTIAALGPDPGRVYEFDLLLQDAVFASIKASAEPEDSHPCCKCGYETKQLQIELPR